MLQLASEVWDCSHDCAIESTGHHEEACSLQPIGFWMKWKCFHEIMTGMGNSFLTTDNKLIILYTRGACISCVLFPKLWSWPSPPRNITTSPSKSLKRKSNVGPLKQHNVLITQFFISLKSRWTELFEDPLEPPVYLYQIKIHSELGSHWNSYVY